MPDYTVGKYKGDPFRPQPKLRVSPKSRRLHKPMGDDFCIRRSKCKNAGRCDECVPLYRLWKEK